GEVAGMRWSEINLETRLWVLPRERVKNDRRHEVPLAPHVVDILAKLERRSDYVFTFNVRAPITDFAKCKKAIDSHMPPDMEPWVLHDLRRSVASGMAKLGITLPVIEKVVNHQSGSFGGIVGVYQHHQFANEKRDALERWGKHLAGLIESGDFADKVLAMRG